jgi:hypothetical protein
MTAPGVRFEVSGTVGHSTLNRPEASNAIDLPTARAFGEAVGAARRGRARDPGDRRREALLRPWRRAVVRGDERPSGTPP